MNASEKPQRETFHEAQYQQRKNHRRPIVSITLNLSGRRYAVTAVADTGCTSALAFSLPYLKALEHKLGTTIDLGNSKNSDVLPARLADGTRVAYNVYEAEITVGTETKKVFISVVDPHTRLSPTPSSKGEDEEDTLLGQGFLDDYDVLFSGLSKPHKKVIFSK